MKILFKDSLYTKLFAPLLLILGLTIIAILLSISSITRDNAIETAIPSAISTVNQYKAIRGYYTKNVVKKVIAGSELKPHYDHKGDESKIPLPATFIHDLSKEFSSKGIMELKLYSAYPFPNRSSRQLDSFGKNAWAALTANPSEVYSQVDEVNNKQVVRVAIADTMVAQGCVDCHNNHPDTPKDNWKLNDVRGVLEVQMPIDAILAAGANLNFKISSFMVIALIITFVILITMFKKLISNRLEEVSSAMQDIADGDGDLSQRLTTSSKDEIGSITQAFNNFVSQFEKSISHVGTQVSQLINTSNNLKSITHQFQDGASQQQNETDQVAAAMNQMTATAQEVANIATTTATETESTEQETQNGQKVISESMQAVETLSVQIAEAADVVNSLEADSQNIGGVLDVIRSIAEQTNLLALNAAIEAARAGEQGRGFAVVADEVRTLAGRTQNATEEIQKMIEQLQEGAQTAVTAITKGNESLQANLDQARQTNDVITSISKSISNVRNLNLQIATAAEEQTNVSEEMNRSVNKIAEVALTSSEGSEQLLNLAEEINNTVNAINAQLSKYTGGSD